MTYLALLNKLRLLNDKQLAENVSVYAGEYDEYFPVDDLLINEGDDILSDQEPYLTLK